MNDVQKRYSQMVSKGERIRLGNLGLQVLEEIARDPASITTARMGAARTLVEVAGYLDKGRAAVDKELSARSPAELRQMIAAIDVALSDQALVAPDSSITIEQELDIA